METTDLLRQRHRMIGMLQLTCAARRWFGLVRKPDKSLAILLVREMSAWSSRSASAARASVESDDVNRLQHARFYLSPGREF